MQKVIIGLVGGVLIIGAVFLFNSKKIIEVKIDEQMAMLQTYGFEVKEKVQEKVQDTDADVKHFVVSLVDADKFAKHFLQYEKFSKGDKKDFLKDFKFGVDVTSSAATISADIYPISFPKNRDILQKLIDKKALFLKINYNSATKKIDGKLKDIDEKIEGNNFKVTGLKFNFTTDDKMDLKYKIKNLYLSSLTKARITTKIILPDNMSQSDINMNVVNGMFDAVSPRSRNNIINIIDIKGISGDISGDVLNGFIKLDKIFLNFNNDIINIMDVNTKVTSDIKNNLLASSIKTTVKSIDIDKIKVVIDNFIFDYGINNIDLDSFRKLVKLVESKKLDLNSPEITENIEKLLSYGIEINLNKFGIDNIKNNQENFKGFSIESKINISKEPNLLKNIQISPMSAISYLKMKSKIKLSDELFPIMMEHPDAKIFKMLKPKDENGYKVYDINLQDEALSVNGLLIR